MRKKELTQLVSFACVLFMAQFPQPSQAQTSQAQTSHEDAVQACRLALEEANTVIYDEHKAFISNASAVDLDDLYSSYPAQKPIGILLRVQGQSAPEVMQSPQLMTELSTSLINRCQPLGMVTFQLDQTDWEATFGLMENQIVPFECTDSGRSTVLNWGEAFCP
ncbi:MULTISPECIES: hypothetical protein [Cyanophyceae]|uniref:hypothetical protein n=1 Tax=Cyanophyceae TaxID=3028117 RepID=UPI001689098B|nr:MULTISPECIES: hypothetical protein [Cyanophyceae]MBD1915279.1 hypothetical protein [Phormidium sp. FACHB-77]MBD2032444.1 hypothetical protein [Phormidium sp. FACHB-322]MBD2051025.1 hypothetical protein [Leptolyngbya sp. FACHB-60]